MTDFGDTTPQAYDATPSALCSTGFTPQIMTGTLVQLVRQHFADRQNLADPILRAQPRGEAGNFLWTPDNATHMGLEIESVTRFDPKRAEKRPAVFVRRNSWQPRKIGINNQVLGRPLVSGQRMFTMLMLGSHTLFCLAGEAGEIENLAYEVASMLVTSGPILREALYLTQFAVAEIGGIGKIKEASNNYAVPITVSYAFENTWQMHQHVPLLKTIGMNAEIHT